MAFKIGIDVGGTFTDFLLMDEKGNSEIYKVPTTPSDPSVGVMSGSAQTKANLPTGVISASMSISGSISASAISTASFGQLRIGGTDGTTSFAVISGSGASGVVRISGSSVSTGSFGRLEVGELSITDDLVYGSTNWNESGGALSVTGSDFFWKSTGGGFDIYDNSDALMFKIENKVAILGARTTTPTAVMVKNASLGLLNSNVIAIRRTIMVAIVASD